MSTQVCVPVPTALFLELASFLRDKGDKRDPATAIGDAIDYWMQNADWKPELIRESRRGYQWKSLFLPEGSQVRMPYKGTYHYAKVVGDSFVFGDESTSPAAFANKVTGSSRNAWRDLWILMPGESEWTLADDYRGSSQG